MSMYCMFVLWPSSKSTNRHHPVRCLDYDYHPAAPADVGTTRTHHLLNRMPSPDVDPKGVVLSGSPRYAHALSADSIPRNALADEFPLFDRRDAAAAEAPALGAAAPDAAAAEAPVLGAAAPDTAAADTPVLGTAAPDAAAAAGATATSAASVNTTATEAPMLAPEAPTSSSDHIVEEELEVVFGKQLLQGPLEEEATPLPQVLVQVRRSIEEATSSAEAAFRRECAALESERQRLSD